MSKKDERLNEIRVNNNGEEMRIIRYGGKADIDVQFEDGTIIEHKRYDHFKEGKIKNPMTPSVYGIGCMGIGKFKPCDENGKPTKCYIAWKNMLMRCYDPNYQETHPRYKGCTVCEEWWNFQKFAEWYYSHYYEFGNNERMTLDKDILHKGNKVYSPENCIFVPNFINVLFVKSDKTRGDCPIGVYKGGDKFRVCLKKDNKPVHLGTYRTPNEAFLAYKRAKEAYIKEVAEKYKSQIPHELYEAMMNYEVEIDD